MHWYIAMEFIQHGNLQQYIGEEGLEATRYRRDFQGAAGEPKEPEAASITGQIAQALLYMHSKNFIHRDLKPLVRFMSAEAYHTTLYILR